MFSNFAEALWWGVVSTVVVPVRADTRQPVWFQLIFGHSLRLGYLVHGWLWRYGSGDMAGQVDRFRMFHNGDIFLRITCGD